MQMHNRHHDKHIRPFQKKDAKREGFCEAPTNIEFDDWVKMRVNDNPVDGILNRRQKPSAEAGLLRFIVGRCLDHLGFCTRMELDRLHTNAANARSGDGSSSASATTFSTVAFMPLLYHF